MHRIWNTKHIDAHERYPNHPDVDAEFQVDSILGLRPYPEDEKRMMKKSCHHPH